MNRDIFESSVRSKQDLAGVFECDGETCYFYLYDQTRGQGNMVVAAIQITNEPPDFTQKDIAVEWDRSETKVGLLIRGKLWAAFDEAVEAYGGHYDQGTEPNIPVQIKTAFAAVVS
jgi:hypothetical protein